MRVIYHSVFTPRALYLPTILISSLSLSLSPLTTVCQSRKKIFRIFPYLLSFPFDDNFPTNFTTMYLINLKLSKKYRYGYTPYRSVCFPMCSVSTPPARTTPAHAILPRWAHRSHSNRAWHSTTARRRQTPRGLCRCRPSVRWPTAQIISPAGYRRPR